MVAVPLLPKTALIATSVKAGVRLSNARYEFVGLINATTVRMFDSLHAYSAHTTTEHYHLARFQ